MTSRSEPSSLRAQLTKADCGFVCKALADLREVIILRLDFSDSEMNDECLQTITDGLHVKKVLNRLEICAKK